MTSRSCGTWQVVWPGQGCQLGFVCPACHGTLPSHLSLPHVFPNWIRLASSQDKRQSRNGIAQQSQQSECSRSWLQLHIRTSIKLQEQRSQAAEERSIVGEKSLVRHHLSGYVAPISVRTYRAKVLSLPDHEEKSTSKRAREYRNSNKCILQALAVNPRRDGVAKAERHGVPTQNHGHDRFACNLFKRVDIVGNSVCTTRHITVATEDRPKKEHGPVQFMGCADAPENKPNRHKNAVDHETP